MDTVPSQILTQILCIVLNHKHKYELPNPPTHA